MVKRVFLHSKPTEPAVKCFKDVVSDAHMKQLSIEAERLWCNAGGERTSAKSFWISKDSSPRCSLEAYALSVARFHCGEEYMGAEFWVQAREGIANDVNNSGLEFHFDKDEKACCERDEWLHPAVATATYLRPSGDAVDIGAPIVIFSTTSEETQTLLRPVHLPPRFSYTILPMHNTHVSFQGNLLHGVPGELCVGDRQYKRLSLLVNIWTQTAPDIDPIGDSFIKEAQGVSSRIRTGCAAVELRGVDYTPGNTRLGWSKLTEHRRGDTALLPIEEIRQLGGDNVGIRVRYR